MEIRAIEDFFDEENTGKGWEYTHSGIDVMPTDFVKEVAKKYAEQFIDLAAESATTKTEKRLVKNHVLNPLNPTGIIKVFTVVDKQSILKLKELIK